VPNNDHLSPLIERHLFDSRKWVTTDEICARFNVTPRALRTVGTRPGLASAFAISSDKGYRHIEHSSRLEWRVFKHRLRRHAIAELRRVSVLQRARNRQTIQRRGATLEKETGQLLADFGVTPEDQRRCHHAAH